VNRRGRGLTGLEQEWQPKGGTGGKSGTQAVYEGRDRKSNDVKWTRRAST
jgi:hypothetical protein